MNDKLQRKYWAIHRVNLYKKERKERCEPCDNGQMNRVHIAITPLRTPKWFIEECSREKTLFYEDRCKSKQKICRNRSRKKKRFFFLIAEDEKLN